MNVDVVAGTATYVPGTEDSDNGYGDGFVKYESSKSAAHSSCISCHMSEAKKTQHLQVLLPVLAVTALLLRKK